MDSVSFNETAFRDIEDSLIELQVAIYHCNQMRYEREKSMVFDEDYDDYNEIVWNEEMKKLIHEIRQLTRELTGKEASPFILMTTDVEFRVAERQFKVPQ